MIFTKTKLKGAYVIDLEPFQDERGLFARTFCQKQFLQIGHVKPFVQINHSLSIHKASIRGMHYQQPPFAEIKLIRCIKGKAYDVIVDIRKESPTFLQYIGIEISAQNQKMMYVPEGFAHGFQTLEPNTELIYHHSNFYQPNTEGGLRYDDPLLSIDWPFTASLLSDKDKAYSFIDSAFEGISI